MKKHIQFLVILLLALPIAQAASDQPANKSAEKIDAKPVEKPADKPAEKAASKAPEKAPGPAKTAVAIGTLKIYEAPPQQIIGIFSTSPDNVLAETKTGEKLTIVGEQMVKTFGETSRWVNVKNEKGTKGWVYAGSTVKPANIKPEL